MLKKYIVVFVFFFPVLMFSQTVAAKYAGEFLAIGIGSRPTGMGGAFAAIANDVTAVYYNPAGLTQLDFPQFAVMHDEQFGKLVNYNYAAVAIPYKEYYTFAFSATRLGIDGIPDTRGALVDKLTGAVINDITNENARIDPSKVKDISNQDWAFYLSAAKKYSDNLSIGANVKIITRSIGEYTAFGLGFDIGTLYRLDTDFMIAASVQDVTTTLVAWSTGRNELITPTVKIGSYYNMQLFGALTVSPAIDIDTRFENRRYASTFHAGSVSFDPHFGIEAAYNKIFSVRGGYNDVKQFTIGAGVKLPKLNIDYSFARFSGAADENLPVSHRISLILTLEEPRYSR